MAYRKGARALKKCLKTMLRSVTDYQKMFTLHYTAAYSQQFDTTLKTVIL